MSDNIMFRLSSFIMAKASPIFKDMLTMPHPPLTVMLTPEYVDEKPIIHVMENSKVMDVFLRCCYSVPNATLNISQLVPVHHAGDKYNVEAVKKHVESELSCYIPQPDHCFCAFVIAWHLQLKDEVRRAAIQMVHLSKDDITDFLFMR